MSKLDERPSIIRASNSDDVLCTLHPSPIGSTGWRIWRMLHSRVPEATPLDYIEVFDRRYLVSGKAWNMKLATANAAAMLPALRRKKTVLLLGNPTREAFGIPPLLIHPQEINGITWRQLPYPGKTSRWYDDKENRAVASMVLESMYLSWRGE